MVVTRSKRVMIKIQLMVAEKELHVSDTPFVDDDVVQVILAFTGTRRTYPRAGRKGGDAAGRAEDTGLEGLVRSISRSEIIIE